MVHLKHCSSSPECEGFELAALLDVWGAVRSRQRDSSDLLTMLHCCLITTIREFERNHRFWDAFMQFTVLQNIVTQPMERIPLAETVDHLGVTRGLDRSSTLLRNVGSYKSHAASHPRRRYSS
jgi:hypothetical protein